MDGVVGQEVGGLCRCVGGHFLEVGCAGEGGYFFFFFFFLIVFGVFLISGLVVVFVGD